ncbi:RING-type E3 ubiquitin transferase [Ranunculus cassubicifolius]
MDDSCAVCAETLEWVAYGECGHRDVCSTCVSRLRFICGDRRCCICKSESDIVYITKALGDYTTKITNFSVFRKARKEGKNGNYWYHQDTGAFFDDFDQYNTIKAMCKLSCSICEKTEERGFKTIDKLNSHFFHKHKKLICTLCLEGRKVFICEQRLYTRTELDQHIKVGNLEVDGKESGFKGHPMCEFCRKSFYGENELYKHMTTQHYTCHICQRQNPGQYEHYKNYDDLEMHFRSLHFLCEHEACLAKKFVVFTSESDLKKHSVSEHGGSMSRSKRSALLQIPTGFRYEDSSSHGRGRGCGHGRGSHHEPPDEQVSETANPLSLEIDEIMPPPTELPQPTIDSSRYRQALSGQNLTKSAPPREEASFPALPMAETNTSQRPSNNRLGKSKIPALYIRQDNAPAIVTSSSNPWSAKNGRIVVASTSYASVPRPVERERPASISSTSDFPPVSQPKTVKTEDVYTANKALQEKIQAALKFDESKYNVFRGLSGEYRQGVIGVEEYLSYVQQFGLSHLVLELAKLCPDPIKQGYLLETYNARVRFSSKQESSVSTKGSKSLNKGKSVAEGVPVGGVWRNGGGQKLVSLTQKNSAK